jgi:hypothetical protein
MKEPTDTELLATIAVLACQLNDALAEANARTIELDVIPRGSARLAWHRDHPATAFDVRTLFANSIGIIRSRSELCADPTYRTSGPTTKAHTPGLEGMFPWQVALPLCDTQVPVG